MISSVKSFIDDFSESGFLDKQNRTNGIYLLTLEKIIMELLWQMVK
jgi:hypothetical protein